MTSIAVWFSRRRLLKKPLSILAVFVMSCLLLGNPLSAWGMGLDTEGKKPPECFAKFRLETFKVSKVRTSSIIYEFRGHMVYQPETSAIACPPPAASGSATVQAEWAYPSRSAAEVGGYHTGSEFHSITTHLSKCDDDPWLNAGVKCDQIGSHSPKAGWPEPRPFTPALLSQLQRSGLIKAVESLALPEILIPTKDQSIKGTKALFQTKVYLPTASTVNSNAEVTVEVKELLWPSPGGPAPMQKTVTAPVVNRHALVTIPLKHGDFQVRARISKPASQAWSKTVMFKLAP